MIKTYENFINEAKEYPHDQIAEKIYNYIVKNQDRFSKKYGIQDSITYQEYNDGNYDNKIFHFSIIKNPKPVIAPPTGDPYSEEEWEEDDNNEQKYMTQITIKKEPDVLWIKEYSISVDNLKLQVSKNLAKKVYDKFNEINDNRDRREKEDREREILNRVNKGIDFLNKEIE